MLEIASFNKAFKIMWIKKYLDKDNHGKWEIFFDLELDSYTEGNLPLQTICVRKTRPNT